MNGNEGLQKARQANMMARQLITASATKRTQNIFSRTVSVASENVLQVAPRYVGLLLGFIVTVQTNIAVGAMGAALTRAPFGPFNLVSQFRYDDLNNNTRVQTTGWHIGHLNSVRGGAPWLACRTNTNYPVDFGNNFPSLIQGAATIGQGENSDVSMTYFVPISYSQQDLRGAEYLGVVNATANLQITLNATPARARTLNNGTDAAYVTADAMTASDATIGDYTVNVFQVYYDQLPASQNGVVLPMMDLATIYDLKNTSFSGLTANEDFPLPYSNFRDFLSTIAIFRNNIAPTAALATEADVNLWKLESANFTNIWNVPPRIAGMWGRQNLEDDLSLGAYYFPTRDKPISTVQSGNFQLVLNAATVNAGAAILVGYESFALQNQIANAGSLPAAA